MATGGAAQALRCSICKAVLPTLHFLDIHISELHDSFFAAQAARKMEVCSPSCHQLQCEFSLGSRTGSPLTDFLLNGIPPGVTHKYSASVYNYAVIIVTDLSRMVVAVLP